MRLVIITGVGIHLGMYLVRMSAQRHLAEDESGSIGAKFGAAVAQ
jgi:hypothetical protein